MIYSLKGRLIVKEENFFVIDVGGVGFKINAPFSVVKILPAIGELVNVFTHLHVREDALELYGFLAENELRFFEMLISISGIGPKSALGILGVDKIENLKAAIAEGRSELLTKASGIGKKTAERVVLELRGKLSQVGSEKLVGLMETDQDLMEALTNLGYTRGQAKEALGRINPKIIKLEERLKEALKILKSS
jgi:Holliday junction DNA helicase RuvA